MITTFRSALASALILMICAGEITPIGVYAESATSTSGTASTSVSSSSPSASSSTSTPETLPPQTTLSTGSSSAASSTAATSSSAQSESSVTSNASTTDATSTNDLSLHFATGAGSSTVSEGVASTATTSANGFLATGAASSTLSGATATTSATSTTLALIGGGASTSATSTPPLAVSSSTQAILTGDANALANILNLINATFVNSKGSILFGNIVGNAGDLDFRNGSSFSGLCSGSPCSGLQGVQINLLSDAHILNDLILSANSGNNTIKNASSSAAIDTGNALAGLNLVNLANVTFANSNYFILTLNAFRDVNGDLILPPLGAFLNSVFGGLSSGSSVSLNNSATVGNDVSASAASGDNSLKNVAGTSTIQSGTGNAMVNVYNQINSLLAGNGVSLMVRVGGSWTGEAQGLLPGVALIRTPTGFLILGKGMATSSAPLALGVAGTSTVDIQNRAHLGALSGENSIENASSSALIASGNAFAGANIVNIANQTIIGRNWLLAIINIFGNFNGNIAFGRPDLWVGDRLEAPSVVQNGSTLTYHITVKNRGDAPATDTVLTEHYDASHLKIGETSMPATQTDGIMTFALGALAPGEERSITYTAVVRDADYSTVITNTSTASEHERDNNPADNTDSTTLRLTMQYTGAPLLLPASASASGGVPGASSSAFASMSPASTTIALSRLTGALRVMPGGIITETIDATNNGTATASSVRLVDILLDPAGAVVHQEAFDIGELTPGDGVRINYDFNFSPLAHTGRYTLVTHVEGANVDPQDAQNGTIDVFIATSSPQQQTLVPIPPDLPFVSTSLPITHHAHRLVIRKPSPLVLSAKAPSASSSEVTIASSKSPHIPNTGINARSQTAAAGVFAAHDALLFFSSFFTLTILGWVARESYKASMLRV